MDLEHLYVVGHSHLYIVEVAMRGGYVEVAMGGGYVEVVMWRWLCGGGYVEVVMGRERRCFMRGRSTPVAHW